MERANVLTLVSPRATAEDASFILSEATLINCRVLCFTLCVVLSCPLMVAVQVTKYGAVEAEPRYRIDLLANSWLGQAVIRCSQERDAIALVRGMLHLRF